MFLSIIIYFTVIINVALRFLQMDSSICVKTSSLTLLNMEVGLEIVLMGISSKIPILEVKKIL